MKTIKPMKHPFPLHRPDDVLPPWPFPTSKSMKEGEDYTEILEWTPEEEEALLLLLNKDAGNFDKI